MILTPQWSFVRFSSDVLYKEKDLVQNHALPLAAMRLQAPSLLNRYSVCPWLTTLILLKIIGLVFYGMSISLGLSDVSYNWVHIMPPWQEYHRKTTVWFSWFWLVPLLVMFILVIKMLITMLSPGWKLVLYSGKQYLQSNIGLLDVTAPRPSQWTELENIFMFMHHKHTPILYIYIYSDSSVYQSING